MASFLRLHDLGRKSLWTDELFVLRALQGDFQHVLQFSRDEVHPPLHWAIAWLSRPLGENEFFFRLPSAIVGILTVLAVYLAGRWLFDDPLAGMLAAFWLAVSPAHLQHSQEVRMYAYQAGFTLMSVVALWGILSGCGRRRGVWAVVWILSTALGLYNSYLTVFLVGAEVLIWGLWQVLHKLDKPPSSPRTIDRLFPLSLAALALLYTPWTEPLWNFLTGRSRTLTERATIMGAGELLTKTWVWFHFDLLILALVIILPAAAVHVWGLRNLRRRSVESFVSLHLLVLFLAIIMSAPFSFVMPRHLLMLLPLYFLMMAHGLSVAGRNLAKPLPAASKKRLSWCVFLLGLLFGCLAIPSLYHYRTSDVMPWRSAAALVRQKAKPGDAILPGIFMSETALRYYLPQVGGESVRLLPFAKTRDELRATFAEEPRIWFVTSFWGSLPEWYRAMIEAELTLSINVRALKPYGDITIRYRE